jgi:hypothetical protein
LNLVSLWPDMVCKPCKKACIMCDAGFFDEHFLAADSKGLI